MAHFTTLIFQCVYNARESMFEYSIMIPIQQIPCGNIISKFSRWVQIDITQIMKQTANKEFN